MSEEYKVKDGLLYTKTHEWAAINGNLITVGLTDYAQKMLHELVFVDLPEVGKKTNKGESFMTVESVKAVSDCYAPVSGEVAEINKGLTEYPERVNNSPYDEGWLAKIRLMNSKDTKDLMDAINYRKYLSTL